jgi:hypothetical protein
MTDHKHLSQDLYEALKEIRDIIKKFEVPPVLDWKMSRIEDALLNYEKQTTRGTGRTTILYMKAIVEALENPGKGVEFIDHYPHKWESARRHEDALKMIIEKLNYNIIVQTKGKAQVYLYNRFGL